MRRGIALSILMAFVWIGMVSGQGANAQPAGRQGRTGLLIPPPSSAAPTHTPQASFRQLEQLGYLEWRDLIVQRQFSEEQSSIV
jgi:hypothetical protein